VAKENHTVDRTGQVFLEHFDVGIARTMGGELIDIEFDGEVVQEYALRVDGVTGPKSYNGMVPIIFNAPEDAMQESLLPHVHIMRSSITPAMNRWHPGGREYYTPAAMAVPVVSSGGVTGPSMLEQKEYAIPYDITYEVHLRARLRVQGDRMLRQVGRYFWAYGQVFLLDSLGEERGYYAFQESLDNLDEIADIADRTMGHTISLRVEAELDFFEPWVQKTLPGLKVSVSKGDDAPGGLRSV